MRMLNSRFGPYLFWLFLGLCALAAAWQAQAAEITVTLEWTEPTFAADPAYPDTTMFRFTRIRWSPVACLDQPPPKVREDQRGQWTHCGFGWFWSERPSSWSIGMPLAPPSWKIDVPANTPAGGERRTITAVIPDANLAWPKIWVLFDFAYGNGFNYHGYQSQEAILERTPTGEMMKPPTVLVAPVMP